MMQSHGDGHLAVQLWVGDTCETEFFVAAEDVAPFWVEKVPTLTALTTTPAMYEAGEKLARAIIAYVRHGQGRSTISEDGMRNREQMEVERAIVDRRRADRAVNQTAKQA